MTTLFNTFPTPPLQSSIRFISYEGPPKQTPRRTPSKKVPSSEEEFPHIDTILGIEPDSNDEWEKREEFVHKAHGVNIVDLTCSVDEANCETSGSGGESDDVGDLANIREGISMPTSQEDTERASDQSVSSKGNSQGNAVVINDSQSDLEADSSDPYKDPALHIDDRPTSPSTLIPEYRSREVPTGTIDTINSETADGAPASELKQIALPSTSSKSSSMVMKQSANGRLPTIDITSSSSSSIDSDSDSNDRKGNCTMLHYQKRSPAAQGHIKKPNTKSNQPFKHNARPAKRRKPLPPSRPSFLNHLSAVKSNVHIANTCYSNDSSDSGDHSSYKSPPNIASKKRKRSQNNVEEEEEYEVENILDSRIYRKKLQYRAKWLGYPEDDPVWYDARNFKNSPHRLGEFYKANPLRPGPPKRLGIWTQCWEEDRDAEDHPDDNKPKRLSARGGEL